MHKPYIASLIGWPDLPAPDKIKAETQFVAALEAELGGEAGILKAYSDDLIAWEDYDETINGPDAPPMAPAAYEQAIERAGRAVLADMQAPQAARFRVDMEWDREPWDVQP